MTILRNIVNSLDVLKLLSLGHHVLVVLSAQALELSLGVAELRLELAVGLSLLLQAATQVVAFHSQVVDLDGQLVPDTHL